MEHICKIILDNKKTFDSVYFDLTEDYNNLLFQVEVNSNFMFCSNLIITDNNNIMRFQRLFGHGDHKYIISENSETTSIGGYPGPINKGQWKLTLSTLNDSLDQVAEEERTVTIHIKSNVSDTIIDNIGAVNWTDYKVEKDKITLSNYDDTKILSPKAGWYAGDFHTHTRLSDGKEYVAGAMKNAKDMNLDFYVTTEHNVIHTGFVETDLLIIPGIEITTYLGHFNTFGIKELPMDYEKMLEQFHDNEKTEENINKLLVEYRKRGYVNSINHPYLHVWKWEYKNTPLDLFDTIEIVNDPTYDYAKESNDKAIKLADKLWENGYKIYALGGSDSHNLVEERYDGATMPSIVGDPRTTVYSENLSAKCILDNVKKGHMCVTRFIEIDPNITLKVDNKPDTISYLPGDKLSDACLSNNYEITYKIKIKKISEDIKVRLLVNGEIAEEQILPYNDISEREVEFNYNGSPASYMWMRAEIRNSKEEFLGYINPIYIGEKAKPNHTFMDVWEIMNE